jgi:hypothetical protein
MGVGRVGAEAEGDDARVDADRVGARAPASVLTARRALALHTRGYVRAQLDGRRWQRPARGVVVTHNGPLTEDERLWVALLGAPAGSALAGLTAARLDRFEGFEPGTIDVLVPCGSRKPVPMDGVTFRRSRSLRDDDIHPARAPRRTRIARSLVDASAWAKSDRLARVLVLAGVQQGRTRPADLQAVVDRSERLQHGTLIRESIQDAEGGIQSLPELAFAQLIRRHGLPEPTRQRALRRPDGKFYLDAAWDDYETACEIQGIPHLKVGRWEADMSRSNEIMIAGPRLLAFSSYAIRHDQPRVADQLTRLLRRGGWSR